MKRVVPFAVCLIAIVPAAASAVEIKNLRPCYGPLGATRTDTRCTPGDSLFIAYDIEGLTFDEKTGKANYTTILELFDQSAKPVFEPKRTPNEVTAQLGGTRMPGDLYLIMGREQKPGKYYVRLTVVDNLVADTKKNHKDIVYPFEVVEKTFNLVGVHIPGVGFPGQQNFALNFAFADMTLDKDGLPNVEVTMKIMDEAGKQVNKTLTSKIPAELPKVAELNLKESNFLPFPIPIYLNRSGRFTVEILAKDVLGNKTARVACKLAVLDVGELGK
jgi:hypothetical protein